jgi:hypothetical protein
MGLLDQHWFPEPQNIKVKQIDDDIIRISKQDNHLQLSREDLPIAIDILNFVSFSAICRAEAEQARDLLKRELKQ